MPDSIAQLADEIAAIRAEATSRATLRIAKVTAVEATAERRVQLDVAGSYWAATDTDAPLSVGDRVYAIQQGAVWVVSGRLDGASAAPPVGSVTMYAGSVAPPGWLLCNGRSLARTAYPALYDALGTAYGAVDATHFSIPDLRARFPLGSTTARPEGATGGTETTTLTVAQLPSHTHTGPSHTHGMSHGHTSPPHSHSLATGAANVAAPATTGQMVADNVAGTTGSTAATINDYTGSTAAAGTGATGATGSGAAIANLPPFQTINFILRAA